VIQKISAPEVLRRKTRGIHGYLAHRRAPPTLHPTVGLRLGPYGGHRGEGIFVVSEVTLYTHGSQLRLIGKLAARAVTISTNRCERLLCCSQEMHVIDYNVPPIVSAAFLKNDRKAFSRKDIFGEVS